MISLPAFAEKNPDLPTLISLHSQEPKRKQAESNSEMEREQDCCQTK
jgi:hypothetical protein